MSRQQTTFEDRRSVLSDVADEVARQSHVLTERPDLLWQQLVNNLQFSATAVTSQLVRSILEESTRSPARWPWARLLHHSDDSTNYLYRVMRSDRRAFGVSPDGATVATIENDGVRLVEIATGIELMHSRGNFDEIKLSPDGGLIAAREQADGSISVIRARSEELVVRVPGSRLQDFAIAPDGSQVVSIVDEAEASHLTSGTRAVNVLPQSPTDALPQPFAPRGLGQAERSHVIAVWDLTSKQCVAVIRPQAGEVSEVALTRSHVLATTRTALKAWSLHSYDLAYEIGGPSRGLCVSDQGTIGACIIDGVLSLFAPTDGAVKLRFERADDAWLTPTGRFLVGRSRSGRITVWSTESGDITFERIDASRSLWDAFSICDDGSYLAIGNNVGTLDIWDLRQADQTLSLAAHGGAISRCRFTSDGRRIVSAGADGIRVWSGWERLQRDSAVRHIGRVQGNHFGVADELVISVGVDGKISATQVGLNDEVWSIQERFVPTVSAVSADGAVIAVGGLDGQISVRNTLDGEIVASESAAGSVISIALDPIGQTLAFAIEDSSAEDASPLLQTCTLFVRNLAAESATAIFETMRLFGRGMHSITSTTFSPDGHFLATTAASIGERDHETSGCLFVWSLRDGTPGVGIQSDLGIDACAFSKDGKVIYGGGPELTIRAYDALTCAERTVLVLNFHPASLTAIGDGSRLAAGGSFGDVIFLHMTSEPTLRLAYGHRGGVNCCTAISATPYVLSASLMRDYAGREHQGGDGRVIVWDARTGGRLITLPLRASAVDVSHDGRYLTVGEMTGAVHVYELMGL